MISLSGMLAWADTQPKNKVLVERPFEVFNKYVKDKGYRVNRINISVDGAHVQEVVPEIELEMTNRRGMEYTYVCKRRTRLLMHLMQNHLATNQSGFRRANTSPVSNDHFRNSGIRTVFLTPDMLKMMIRMTQYKIGDISYTEMVRFIEQIHDDYGSIGVPNDMANRYVQWQPPYEEEYEEEEYDDEYDDDDEYD